MKILIAGELNVDLVLQNYHTFPALGREVLVDDVSLTLGSASAICAAGLAKLGDAVIFAGKLGCDSWGDLCFSSLTQLGVDCSLVVREEKIKTGITVSITAKDRALVTYLGSIAELRASDIGDEDLKKCRHLHVSSFFLQKALRPDLKSLFSRAHRFGLTTSLDPGFDPDEQWGDDLFDVLTEVDVFFPNEVELAAISGRNAEALRSGPTLTIAKLGSQGCRAIGRDLDLLVPSFPVAPIDTTGAGDSFNAGFLHAWLPLDRQLGNDELKEAMRFAAACGALSTLALGGTAGQPDEQRAREFISKALAAPGGHS
ncbi:MAG TPA: carbohydrate kinase family protein [Bryobacteraceae bacterium]|nr:carbohydrate kinase family protein [Bryobacteraceae bacterium]